MRLCSSFPRPSRRRYSPSSLEALPARVLGLVARIERKRNPGMPCRCGKAAPGFANSQPGLRLLHSLPRLFGIAQIGRRLVLLRLHEITVAADKVPFLPAVDVHAVFRAQVFVALDLARHPP